MPRSKPACPCCQRPFRSILDYPRVRILSFERLPVPEAVDTMSAAAAEKWLARRQKAEDEERIDLRREGINLTPAIEEACRTPAVVDYFEQLAGMVGKTLKPKRLLPTLPAHGMFKWAYPIPGTKLYLSLGEDDETPDETAEVLIHCKGPNMGSAGGPTMQILGPIARLGFQGLLADGTPAG